MSDIVPLPEPVDDVWVMWRGERELLRAEDNYYTAAQLRAYGAAVESAAIELCIAAVLSAPVKAERQDQREACVAAIRALTTSTPRP